MDILFNMGDKEGVLKVLAGYEFRPIHLSILSPHLSFKEKLSNLDQGKQKLAESVQLSLQS